MHNKIKKYVPSLEDYITEAFNPDIAFNNESVVNDLKKANNDLQSAENEMNTAIKDFQQHKIDIKAVEQAVQKYINFLSQEKYLTIMNGINSQSNKPESEAEQNGENQPAQGQNNNNNTNAQGAQQSAPPNQ